MTDASQSAQTSGLVVGLDIGTTAVKAVVANEAGNIVGRHRLPSELIIGPTGRFEHDAVATWWEGPRVLLREILDQSRASGHGEPQAVAVSAMMPSVAAVDDSAPPAIDPDAHGAAAPLFCNARKSPSALARVSASSWAGLESATMPAPARNDNARPRAVMVRMRMLKSQLPSRFR